MSFSGLIIASGRFFDFYFVSAIFLAAVAATILAERREIIVQESLQKYILAGFFIFFLLASTNSFLNIKQFAVKNDYRPTGEIAGWIADKSGENERIFLNNWSYFPVAFFYNSKNVYTTGIEPMAALRTNPALYWKWFNIFVYGFYCERPEDCSSQKKLFDEKISQASDENQKALKKDNSKKS